MKTKEEIEQLALRLYPDPPPYTAVGRAGLNQDKNDRLNFTNGYTQCQEDIRKIWQNSTISEKADFIELLNKQD